MGDGFFHYRRFPWKVDVRAFYAARAKTCREIEQAVVASESGIETCDGATVAVNFVDGDKQRLELWQVHQEIVDREEDVVSDFAHGGNQSHSVGTAQRVVGNYYRTARSGDAVDVLGLHFDRRTESSKGPLL